MHRTKEQIRKAVFSKLRILRRKLNRQGIPCTYARSVLSHDDENAGFRITIQATGNNGDTTLLPRLSIRTGDNVEEFDQANFEHGLTRIRDLFHAGDSHDDV